MTDAPLEAAQRLADLLARENDALKRLDFSSAVALVPAKEAALADLRPPRAGGPAVTAMGRRLTSLAAENQILLQRAITVQTSIVRIVAKACVPPPAMPRYNAYGARTPSSRAAALALSTRA